MGRGGSIYQSEKREFPGGLESYFFYGQPVQSLAGSQLPPFFFLGLVAETSILSYQIKCF